MKRRYLAYEYSRPQKIRQARTGAVHVSRTTCQREKLRHALSQMSAGWCCPVLSGCPWRGAYGVPLATAMEHRPVVDQQPWPPRTK
jgi:hypothetical protein